MLFPIRAVLALAAGLAVNADTTTVCSNAAGMYRGGYYTFWHDTGAGCLTLRRDGGYGVDWQLGAQGNLVAGRGWAKGSPNRVVRYTARAFEPGVNGYLSLYGWSTNPLVEYYVVENWGNFTPPGSSAVFLGTIASDGGTYRLYRARRVRQPSIAGTATFDQYWSVRTSRRATGTSARITFANHVSAWRQHGLRLGTLGYQVIATEGFGSIGRSDISLADR